jgi:uncharacterized protein (DUF736 family)
MAQPKKPNQGYLNSNKKGNEKHPDYRAEVPVDAKFIKGLADAAADGGAAIYMAGWKGISQRTGEPYIFLRLDSEKYQKPASSQTTNNNPAWEEEF